MNTSYSYKDFIKYQLKDGRSLTAKQIHKGILEMPCKKPWGDNSETPQNTISARCLDYYKAGILDREKINRVNVYWLK